MISLTTSCDLVNTLFCVFFILGSSAVIDSCAHTSRPQKPTIYRNLNENTGPADVVKCWASISTNCWPAFSTHSVSGHLSGLFWINFSHRPDPVMSAPIHRQIAVSVYFSKELLLLSVFALHYGPAKTNNSNCLLVK